MMTKKQYWYEALVGGTIVGVVAVAFSILLTLMGGTTAEPSFGVKAVNFLSVFVNITLLFGLTRRFSAKYTLEEGFSFGRGLGFVVAMMIFAGVISGIYNSVMANYFIKAEVRFLKGGRRIDLAEERNAYCLREIGYFFDFVLKGVSNINAVPYANGIIDFVLGAPQPGTCLSKESS